MMPDHPALNDQDWLDARYTSDGLSDRAIADMLGCPQHQVTLARRRLGIAGRPRGHNLRKGNGHGQTVCNYMLRPGATVPFAGRRHTDEARSAISRAAQRPRPCLRGSSNGMYGRTGSANPNYRHGLSPERQRVQSSAEYQEFLRRVEIRDGHHCRRCGQYSAKKRGMHVHHIYAWEDFPELRTDVDNGVLLCRRCHEWVHSAENIDREWLGQKEDERSERAC